VNENGAKSQVDFGSKNKPKYSISQKELVASRKKSSDAKRRASAEYRSERNNPDYDGPKYLPRQSREEYKAHVKSRRRFWKYKYAKGFREFDPLQTLKTRMSQGASRHETADLLESCLAFCCGAVCGGGLGNDFGSQNGSTKSKLNQSAKSTGGKRQTENFASGKVNDLETKAKASKRRKQRSRHQMQ
jgi:hypothetical protein